MEFLGDVPGVRANKFTEGRRGRRSSGKSTRTQSTALILAILAHTRVTHTHTHAHPRMYTHTYTHTYLIVNRTWCGNWFGQGWVRVAASLKRRIYNAIDSGIEETREAVELKIAKSRWDADTEATGRIGQFNTLANRVTLVTCASRSVPMSLRHRARIRQIRLSNLPNWLPPRRRGSCKLIFTTPPVLDVAEARVAGGSTGTKVISVKEYVVVGNCTIYDYCEGWLEISKM